MKKPEAIERINRMLRSRKLHLRNIHFANVNARKSVWWFDIPVSKIESDVYEHLHLLLYDQCSGHLHHLQVLVKYFRSNRANLVVRNDKGTISLELSTVNSKHFRDVRPTGAGVEFKQFRQRST